MTKPTALIAMPSFKGSLTNEQACAAVAEALAQNSIPCELLPIGDGGFGTRLALQKTLGGETQEFTVSGPLGKKVVARVLLHPHLEAPRWAYVESAEACGHHLVAEAERDAMRASSYGLGELLREVGRRWPKLERLYVGLGDTAVSDMGMGMLCALGYRFLDENGREVWGNATGLRQIRTVHAPAGPSPIGAKLAILCDVLNPLLGANGSARIFSEQKGATPGQVRQIEQGMENFASVILSLGNRDVRSLPMGGAAGGIAAALASFFPGELLQGSRFLLDWIGFDGMLELADCVITGEGSTDLQTSSGKAPFECLERAARLGKKAFVFSGKLGVGHESVARRREVAGLFACGLSASPFQALKAKVGEIFSQPEVLRGLIPDEI